ncbi:TPA: hypothetical protein ACH3X1_008470 [Trebouxia sp. C0004]
MDSNTPSKGSFMAIHKVELGTAAVIAVLGVGLGLALPEDQSVPHRFNRIITVWLNHRRQSTLGWNINQVLLDLSGGFFSVTQLCVEAFVKEDLSAITGDPVKFGLGLVSVVFDIMFMIQHYTLYRENNAKLIEEAPKARYTMVSPDQSRQSSQQDEQPLLTASASTSVSEEGLSGPQPSKTHSMDTVVLPTSCDQDHVV